MAPIRLTVLDDGPFVRTYAGELRPVSENFNRFVEAVSRSGAFARVRYVVPVRRMRIWELEPALEPVDEQVLEIVPTTWFSGIADYFLRLGWIGVRNWGLIEHAVADSDLLWIRLPASNGLLALAAARRNGVPHFGWVSGGASDVLTALVGKAGPLVTLDDELFPSIVTATEIDASSEFNARDPRSRPSRIIWAGRMRGDSGLGDLIESVAQLRAVGRDVTLVLIGDGPARPAVERQLARLPGDCVEDFGFVGDRDFYMSLLRAGDVLVQPSRVAAPPEVLIDAMTARLPIVAAETSSVHSVLGGGERCARFAAGDPAALASAIGALIDDAPRRATLATAGLAWAADHTADRQAIRLVRRLKQLFPLLGWED